MHSHLISLYDKARMRLETLGLKMGKVAYSRDKIEKATEHDLKVTIEWLEAFIDVRIKELDRAIGLVGVEVWTRYRAMGIVGLREQLIRERAENAVLKDWRHRPDLLKRGTNESNGKGKNKPTGKSSKRPAKRPKPCDRVNEQVG